MLDLEARGFGTDAVLRDGGSVHIRAIRPDDKDRLLDHFRHLGPESVYRRFFGAKKTLTSAELVQFTELDFVRRVGLVATLREHAEERIVGVGRYIGLEKDGVELPRAEVAFAVADEHQGRGIGSLLLRHLVPLARASGIVEFEASVLGDNSGMLKVFSATGLVVERSLAAEVFHLSFPTEETERSREAAESRERQAAGRSVRAFIEPRSVAVIGASRRPGSLGTALLANLKRAGFAGPLYPVHPRAGEIEGLPAYQTLVSIGAPVDLAIVAVPAAGVESVMEDCAAAGVHGVVVVAAGFAEVSREGRVAQDRLKHLVRGSGMRLVGPNAMGVLNTDPAVRLNATFAQRLPAAGSIGIMSQSGALGLALLEQARRLDLGVSTFASVGNKADVSGNDLLSYWADDPRTDLVLLYLESFGNPRRFARLAPEVGRSKPVLALKSGRSVAGARAASGHSAAAAVRDAATDALFDQAGVIRTETLEELFDVATLLSTQPVPRGPRVGVVTNAGGAGTLLADACEGQGLTLPGLSMGTLATLRSFLPAQASLANPVDMIASASASDYARAVEALGRDDQVDAVVVIHAPLLRARTEEIAAAVARAAGEVPADKPVLAVFLAAARPPAALVTGRRGRLPSYTFPENAARALAAAERYARWRRRPKGAVLELSPFARSTVRAVVQRVLEKGHGPRWLDGADVATVLGAAGIDLAVPEPTMGEATTPVEPGTIEAIVGVTSDATFGPLVFCGLGGVLVELLQDVSLRLTPVSDLDAAEMIAKLRSHPLLDGYHGAPPADKGALVSLIRRVSALVDVLPELRELHLDPVAVFPMGGGAMVRKARICVGDEVSAARSGHPVPAVKEEVRHV